MPRFLALDWDQQQLHVVAADAGGRAVKVVRAAVWHEEQPFNPADAETLGKLLRERLKAAGIAPAPVLVCVSRDRVILKDIRYPAVPAVDEPAVVRFQAVKELTDAADDVVLDYAPYAEEGDERRALAVVVRKDLLAAYQKLCVAAGLKLFALTPRPFGLAAGADAVAGAGDGPTAIVAVGDGWAEFCIARGHTLLMARSLAASGNVPGEVRRNLAVFAGQSSRTPLGGVRVAGPEELVGRLAGMTDLPVTAFDPFDGVANDALPAGERGSFAAAVGLLYAQARPEGLPINFVKPRQPRPERAGIPNRVVAGAVAVVLLLVGSAYYCRSLQADYARRLEEAGVNRSQIEDDLDALTKKDVVLRALDEHESIVWIDELYDLCQRVKDIDALRVVEMKADTIAHDKKNPSRYRGTLHIKGTLRETPDNRRPVDELVAEIRRDGFYSVESPKIAGNSFELVVNIERRAPGDYKRRLAGS